LFGSHCQLQLPLQSSGASVVVVVVPLQSQVVVVVGLTVVVLVVPQLGGTFTSFAHQVMVFSWSTTPQNGG